MFGTPSTNRKRFVYAATLGVCVVAAATIAVNQWSGLQRVAAPEYPAARAQQIEPRTEAGPTDAGDPVRASGVEIADVAGGVPGGNRKSTDRKMKLTLKPFPDKPMPMVVLDPTKRYYATREMGSSAGTSASLTTNIWVEQGPRPMTNPDGGTAGIISPDGPNPSVGAISAVAQLNTTPFYTGNPDIIYVATVNGGVWKTTDGTAASPRWIPLSDQGQFNGGGLPAGMSLNSIEISPLDANTIFVGAGRTSAFAQEGGNRFGIGRSTDGGATWTVVNISGLEIRSVVPTQVTDGGQQVVLAGAAQTVYGGAGGVFRSTDGGASYTLVTNGIPASAVTDLVGDPGVPTRFYAATREGKIYISNDTGANWTQATGTGFTVVNGARILLSVHNSGVDDVVYSEVIGTDNTLSAVYRSADQGANWTDLGVPPDDIFPGSQGFLHGAMEADPNDPSTVYLGGDDGPRLVRWANGVWDLLDQAASNGTKPHGDTRDLDFDPDGNILRTDDGGVFKLNNPNSAGRVWSSLCGNLGAAEVDAAAYDSLSNIVFASFQDAAVHYQQSTGSLVWDQMEPNSEEGSHVFVDADQTAHPGISLRYFGKRLPEKRMTFDANNNFVSEVPIPYDITSGPGTGSTIFDFDTGLNVFNGNAILNRLNSARLLLTATHIYESTDKGETVANLGPISGGGATRLFSNGPITYGGLNGDGTPNPGSFYVGSAENKIYHRTNDSSSIVTLDTYPDDGFILALVSDPKNVSHVFVLNSNGRVWGSFDEGATWIELTANLGTITSTPYLRTMEMIPNGSSSSSTLLVGGLGGIWQMPTPGAAGNSWTSLGPNLPQALVYDLRYDDTDNLLLAGILGRGAWTLTNPDIDDCLPNPCQNGGTCTDGVNGHSCACAPGYTGTNCETNINECSPNPCQNGGTCADGVNGYSCACPPGFSGVNCEISGGVFLNEVHYDQASGEQEFIELYAVGGTFDLTGWVISDQDEMTYVLGRPANPSFPCLDTFTLNAGDRVVLWQGVGTSMCTGSSRKIYLNRGTFLQRDGDDVALRNAQGVCQDYVAFETGTSVSPATPPGCSWTGPNPGNGNTAGRSLSRFDVPFTDSNSGSDWERSGATTTIGPKTPGAVNVSVNQPFVLDRRVSAGSDDAEQKGSSVDLSSGDLEFVFDNGSQQITGVRFRNITIPQGQTITNAYIQFQTDEIQSGTPTNVTMRVQNHDNAPTFTTASNNISNRSLTGSVSWNNIPAWNVVGENGPNQRTPDISSLIQAVVNRSGWVSGNALVIVFSGQLGSATLHRTAESFEGLAAAAPVLHVEFGNPLTAD